MMCIPLSDHLICDDGLIKLQLIAEKSENAFYLFDVETIKQLNPGGVKAFYRIDYCWDKAKSLVPGSVVHKLKG